MPSQTRRWVLKAGRRPLPFFGDGPLTEEQYVESAERYMQDYLGVTIEDIKRNGPYEQEGTDA